MRHFLVRGLLGTAAAVGCLVSSAAAWAASPAVVPIDGFLTDSSGTPIDGTASIRFRLYDAAVGGSVVFEELSSITIDEGHFTALLGEVNPLDLSIFRDEITYLGIEVNGTAMTTRLPLGSSPYAGYAAYAGSAGSAATATTANTANAVAWANVTGVPASLLDGDDVGASYTASLPVSIAGTNVSLSSVGCATGAIWTWTGATWACLVPASATYTAGDGLTLAGGQFSVNATIQRRVSGSCSSSEYIYQVNADGTVLCATDDVGSDGDITAVTTAPGSGLDGGATSGAVALTVDTTEIQARVTGTCGANQAVQSVNANGTVNCVNVLAASSATPAGAMMQYAGPTAPTGWLIADGSEVSRTVYADLFAAIGVAYGAGDGANTFNLPDLRGRVAVGAGNGTGLTPRTRGQAFGAESTTLGMGNLPNATLNGGTGTAGSHSHTVDPPNVTHNHSGTTTTDGNHSHLAYTTNHDVNEAGSQGFPAGNYHHSFRTSDRGRTHFVVAGGNALTFSGIHAHSFTTSTANVDVPSFNSGSAGDHSHTASVSLPGSSTPISQMQPSLVVNTIIKF